MSVVDKGRIAGELRVNASNESVYFLGTQFVISTTFGCQSILEVNEFIAIEIRMVLNSSFHPTQYNHFPSNHVNVNVNVNVHIHVHSHIPK